MILIIGCGFLGSYVLKHITETSKEPVIATVRDMKNIPDIVGVEYIQCELTNTSDITKLADKCKNEPLTVFYFAACHNIDFVYENPEKAKKINIDSLELFISSFPNIKRLFFASTDCVYGEGKENNFKFNEISELNPINEYGNQKKSAEEIVHANGFTVCRLPFMLGPSLSSKPHFYDNICSKLLNEEKIEMIDGMKRNVLSYEQVAMLIFELSKLEKLPDTINICSDKVMSKYEIGCVLAKKLNVSLNLVQKITEKDSKKFFKDRRASCIDMDNVLLKKLIGVTAINWEEE